MSLFTRTVAAIVLVATPAVLVAPARAACQARACPLPPLAPPPPPPPCRVDDASVKASLSRLLAAEELAAAQALSVVVPLELDGDMSTQEGLATVVAPELCRPGFACEALIVACRAGQLVSLGHGTALTRLRSSSRGWADLAQQTPSLFPFIFVTTKVVRYDGARYH